MIIVDSLLFEEDDYKCITLLDAEGESIQIDSDDPVAIQQSGITSKGTPVIVTVDCVHEEEKIVTLCFNSKEDYIDCLHVLGSFKEETSEVDTQ